PCTVAPGAPGGGARDLRASAGRARPRSLRRARGCEGAQRVRRGDVGPFRTGDPPSHGQAGLRRGPTARQAHGLSRPAGDGALRSGDLGGRSRACAFRVDRVGDRRRARGDDQTVKGRRLWFVGIGGAGLSAYAQLARAWGAEVGGWDRVRTPYLEPLAGVPLEIAPEPVLREGWETVVSSAYPCV